MCIRDRPKEAAVRKVDEVLELVDLIQEKNHKVRTFSGGMLRRLGIAQAVPVSYTHLSLYERTVFMDRI